MRLFCLPYAGGRETVFRRWQAAMPTAVEVCPIELPGHGRRIAEPLCCDLESMVMAVASTMADTLDAPFGVFGHSMGALVAFELARHLQSRVGPRPLVLYLSGRRAPQIVDRRPPWYALPRD